MDHITILLADDHDLFCEGLAELLRRRPELEVVGRAADVAQTVAMARTLMPDIILMDVRMPLARGAAPCDSGGLEATRRIKAELPAIRILMLTMSEDDVDLFGAIKAGAQGYLLKNTTTTQLVRYIEAAVAGEAPISGTMAVKMLAELAQPSASPREARPEEGLSEREEEVLHCLANGMSNRQIAEQLVISENTVKKHLRNILDKLHVQNRVQAALIARSRRADRDRP